MLTILQMSDKNLYDFFHLYALLHTMKANGDLWSRWIFRARFWV